MNFSKTREFILYVIIAFFMGVAWGWWPLYGFFQGAIFAAWLIVLVLEKTIGND